MSNNRWLEKEKLLKWLDEKADALYFGAVQAKVVEIFREIESGTFDAPEANQLREENAKLVQALEWYGDTEQYAHQFYLGKSAIEADRGHKAITVLSELRGRENNE
jgi:hypothetical protein